MNKIISGWNIYLNSRRIYVIRCHSPVEVERIKKRLRIISPGSSRRVVITGSSCASVVDVITARVAGVFYVSAPFS